MRQADLMQTFLEESLQRDIDRIRGYISDMARLAGKALRDCVKSLVENNRQLAYAVILRDQYINEKEKEIDRLCLEFLVRQQPVALPLRFAYSTIKINLDLERVGDYAESIAYNILRLNEAQTAAVKNDIVKLADLCIGTFEDAIRSFIGHDTELARRIIESEGAVDALRNQINETIIGLFTRQNMSFDAFDPLMAMVRRFERVSDQARNISMETVYMCTGEYTKHPNTQTFRILFFDKHNSCASQIAEAIGNSLNNPKFIFASAGLEPRPIDAATADFLKEKGFNPLRMAPKAVMQIPHLDLYQVIVMLAGEAHTVFPRPPRKVVMLDWRLDDPSTVQGPAEKIREAYEKTYAALHTRVKELVDAVIGVENGSIESAR